MTRSNFAVLLLVLACLLVGLVFALKQVKKGTDVSVITSPSPAFAAGTPTVPSPPAQSMPQRPLGVAGISPRPKSKQEARAEAVKTVQSVFGAPIAFYGKVVDQQGEPVAGATVEYSAVDKFWGPASNYHGQTDENGGFSITGIEGAGLTVGVSKSGYDIIDGKSFQAFGYGMGVDEYRQRPPTQDDPAVFILRKKAKAEPLVVVSSRQYPVNRTGVPTAINLETAGAGTSGPNSIQVSVLTHDGSKNAMGHYDWDFGISVPGGGLVERTDGMIFTAPDGGYAPQAQVQVKNPDSSPRWTSEVDKQYFVRLADGRYARIAVTAYVGRRTFVVLESYMNPNPGDQNLEYDPQVQAAAK